jgi:hypothetical protein
MGSTHMTNCVRFVSILFTPAFESAVGLKVDFTFLGFWCVQFGVEERVTWLHIIIRYASNKRRMRLEEPRNKK